MDHIRLMVDTEFTNFTSLDVISIGAISVDTDHRFYGETSDNAHHASDFVKQHVFPLLKGGDSCHTSYILAKKWVEFIDSLPGEEVELCVDFPGDVWVITGLVSSFVKNGTLSPPKKRMMWSFSHEALNKAANLNVTAAEWSNQYNQQFIRRHITPHNAASDAFIARCTWRYFMENKIVYDSEAVSEPKSVRCYCNTVVVMDKLTDRARTEVWGQCPTCGMNWTNNNGNTFKSDKTE